MISKQKFQIAKLIYVYKYIFIKNHQNNISLLLKSKDALGFGFLLFSVRQVMLKIVEALAEQLLV